MKQFLPNLARSLPENCAKSFGDFKRELKPLPRTIGSKIAGAFDEMAESVTFTLKRILLKKRYLLSGLQHLDSAAVFDVNQFIPFPHPLHQILRNMGFVDGVVHHVHDLPDILRDLGY